MPFKNSIPSLVAILPFNLNTLWDKINLAQPQIEKLLLISIFLVVFSRANSPLISPLQTAWIQSSSTLHFFFFLKTNKQTKIHHCKLSLCKTKAILTSQEHYEAQFVHVCPTHDKHEYTVSVNSIQNRQNTQNLFTKTQKCRILESVFFSK